MAAAELTEMMSSRVLDDSRYRKVWVEFWKGQLIDMTCETATDWTEAGATTNFPIVEEEHANPKGGVYCQRVKRHPRPENAAGQIIVSAVYQRLKTFV